MSVFLNKDESDLITINYFY